VKATEVKSGMAVNLDGRVLIVLSYEHTKPGKGPAYMQLKMKDVKGGSIVEKRFGSSDNVDTTTLDRRDAEYLYEDADGYVFMDLETFDQFTLQRDMAESSMPFLRPNTQTLVIFHDETPLLIELPSTVDLEVTECQPGIKGATVTNQLKEAVLETGLKTRVPPFIEQGETVRISTTDGSYMGRSKDAG
jgi:elongation factor P